MTTHPRIDRDRLITFRMGERTDRMDFDIRPQGVRRPPEMPHRHDHFEIYINIDRLCRHLICGQEQLLPARSICFVLPHRLHYVAHDQKGTFFVINFTAEFFRPGLCLDPTDPEITPFAAAPELAPFLAQSAIGFTFDEDDFGEVLDCVRSMLRANGNRHAGSAIAVRGALLSLIGITMRVHGEAVQAALAKPRSSTSSALVRVLHYIDEHVGREISLHDAAEAARLSPTYLSQLVRRQLDRSFTELVTERRLALAKDLLAGSTLRIGEIAECTGFSDEAYFSRRFRRFCGETPAAFRRGAAGLTAIQS
jgi:AraC-like DNA-binding protein